VSAQQKARKGSSPSQSAWPERMEEAEWVREMRAHYARTGAFRPQDLRRLLGDPAKGVEMGAGGSFARYFHQ